MGAAKKFKNLGLPRQQGEYARLRVLQGPDYGHIYVVTGSRLTVGRGEDNDVVVSDLKASRRHAEFRYETTGWKVSDLGSANGILHNGKVTRQASLKAGDTVVLGETTFEFLTSEVGTQVLLSPPSRALAIVEQAKVADSALEVHRQRVRSIAKAESLPQGALFNNVGRTTTASEGGSTANRRRIVIYGALGLGLLFVFGTDNKSAPKKTVGSKAGATRPTNDGGLVAAPQEISGQQTRAVASQRLTPEMDAIFKAGFREFRARNFLRAKDNFQNVLNVVPTHENSQKYLTYCNDAIAQDVKRHLDRGKRGQESGKLKSAKANYEAVLRLLHTTPDDPSFLTAREELQKVEKRMKDGDES